MKKIIMNYLKSQKNLKIISADMCILCAIYVFLGLGEVFILSYGEEYIFIPLFRLLSICLINKKNKKISHYIDADVINWKILCTMICLEIVDCSLFIFNEISNLVKVTYVIATIFVFLLTVDRISSKFYRSIK